MNKENLIRLGAMLQERYRMADNYKYYELPSDSMPSFRVAYTKNEGLFRYVPVEYDDIQLEKFGIMNNFETIWAGYSPKANALVIKESV